MEPVTSTAPSSPASSRARASAAAARRHSPRRRRRAGAQRLSSVAGGSAPGRVERVNTTASTARQQDRQHASPRPCRRAPTSPPTRWRSPTSVRQRRPRAPARRAGLCAPSRIMSGSRATTSRRPGSAHDCAAAADVHRVERSMEGLGRGHGDREVRALERSARAATARPGRRSRAPTAAAARRAPRTIRSATVSASAPSGPATSVPPSGTTASFSSAMWRSVGPSQRVCSRPTLVRTSTRRADHAGGVVAAAEAGLHHRDLDLGARQLPVRRRGQRLELRHAVAFLQPAVDQLRRLALRGRSPPRSARP